MIHSFAIPSQCRICGMNKWTDRRFMACSECAKTIEIVETVHANAYSFGPYTISTGSTGNATFGVITSNVDVTSQGIGTVGPSSLQMASSWHDCTTNGCTATSQSLLSQTQMVDNSDAKDNYESHFRKGFGFLRAKNGWKA
jgi:hypothetical protein